MKITVEVELRGSVWSWNDVIKALEITSGSLTDPDESLEVGNVGYVFDKGAQDVGQFIVQDRSVKDYQDPDVAEAE